MHRRIAVCFPGQGAQRVGMAASLWSHAAGRLVLEEIDDALQTSLSRLMRDGPMDALTRTENTQPAIFAHSVAAYRVLQETAPELDASVSVVMGHSVGEYAALTVAGALPIAAGARLLRERGASMQRAADDFAASVRNVRGTIRAIDCEIAFLQAVADHKQCGMAALLLSDAAKAQLSKCVAEATELCSQQPAPCSVAAINSSAQIVLSGVQSSVDAVADGMKKRGWSRRALRLPVSAPFHSSIMTAAQKHMAPLIEAAPIGTLRVPMMTNLSATACSDVPGIKAALIAGITAPVRWHDAVRAAAGSGVGAFLSCGPGRAVLDFARDSLPASTETPKSMLVAVSESEDVSAAVKSLLE